jgi:hypothetical protein
MVNHGISAKSQEVSANEHERKTSKNLKLSWDPVQKSVLTPL